MSGSLKQYTCCDWDVIDKLAIVSHGKIRDTFCKYNFTFEETYKRILVCLFWKCFMEDTLINYLGVILIENVPKTQDIVGQGKPALSC